MCSDFVEAQALEFFLRAEEISQAASCNILSLTHTQKKCS